MPAAKDLLLLTSKLISHDKTQMPGQRNRRNSLRLIPPSTRTFGEKSKRIKQYTDHSKHKHELLLVNSVLSSVAPFDYALTGKARFVVPKSLYSRHPP